MKINKLVIKDGIFEKSFEFSGCSNLVYSIKNSVGKTTLLRAILYALGYPVPSTKGIKFNEMEFFLALQSNGEIYHLYRHDSYLSIDHNSKQMDFSLPTDFHEIMTLLTGCCNADIIDNLLGAAYVDQEKGWTLLNRGKVIGNISFNIEALVRGLSGRDCTSEIHDLQAVETQLKKYKYMYSVAKYQNELYYSGENLEFDTAGEDRDVALDSLRLEREPLLAEAKQIKNILRKNRMLVDYISELKLTVVSSTGEEIPVTKTTLIGFMDNTELLVARREMLHERVRRLNRTIQALEKQQEEDDQMFRIQTAIEEFDSDIKKIHVDPIATKHIVDQLNTQRKELRNHIKTLTQRNNDVVVQIYDVINAYARELGVDETHVAPNPDFIFTKDLKSLSGAILHKIVFSFKLAYIRLIKEKAGIVLPIILDSPSGREVESNTVQTMLSIIQRDFPEHQLIVASIYNYDLRDKKTIEIKSKLFEDAEI